MNILKEGIFLKKFNLSEIPCMVLFLFALSASPWA